MDLGDIEDATINIVGQTLVNEYFDTVIGHIEDIVLSEKFQKLHEEFLAKYWPLFQYGEENKLEYMEIFKEYNATFEAFFIKELSQRMDDFDMGKFAEHLNVQESLQNSIGSVDSEIFELLYSFSNFQVFKDLILDYRRNKEGLVKHLHSNILVTKALHEITNLCAKNDDTCAANN